MGVEEWHPEGTIRSALSACGKRRIASYQRQDGLFSFSEDRYVCQDLDQFAGDIYCYWTVGEPGGLFETEEAAWTSATAHLPWLHAALGKGEA